MDAVTIIKSNIEKVEAEIENLNELISSSRKIGTDYSEERIERRCKKEARQMLVQMLADLEVF